VQLAGAKRLGGCESGALLRTVYCVGSISISGVLSV